MSVATELMTNSGTDELIALLKQQRDLYHRLLNESRRQAELIRGDEPERLLGVLSQRQQLLDQLQAIADAIKPYQAEWEQVRATLSLEDRHQVGSLVAQINDLLRSIMTQDEQDSQLLVARKSTTAKDVGEMRSTRQAGAAYESAGRPGGSTGEWTDE